MTDALLHATHENMQMGVQLTFALLFLYDYTDSTMQTLTALACKRVAERGATVLGKEVLQAIMHFRKTPTKNSLKEMITIVEKLS